MEGWAGLSFGLVLGISAGLSPGPLMSLVIAQTMAHGGREGIKVSLPPLLTDPPIILASLLLLRQFASQDPILGGISWMGAGMLLLLARGVWRAEPPGGEGLRPAAPRSILKGLSLQVFSLVGRRLILAARAPRLNRARGHRAGAGDLIS